MTRVPRRLLCLFVLYSINLGFLSRAQHVDVNEVIHKATAGPGAPGLEPDRASGDAFDGRPQPPDREPVVIIEPAVEQNQEPPSATPEIQAEPRPPEDIHVLPQFEEEELPSPAQEENDPPPPAQEGGDMEEPPPPPPPEQPAEQPAEQPPEQPAEQPPEQPPAQETPQDSAMHNPWITPSQPDVELEAGQRFNFTWTPNTDGLISLELWKIEDGLPVPKFQLAANMPNEGHWTWAIHINFPHGAGYTLVIVPDIDRNLASLSPLFAIVGDQAFDSIAPPPRSADHDPHAGVRWDEIEVNREGNGLKMGYAVFGGLFICNAFLFLSSHAKGPGPLVMGARRRGFQRMEKQNGRKVFHARSVSAKV